MMIDAYELHVQMDELHKQLENFDKTLNIDEMSDRYQDLSTKTERADFWDDQNEAQNYLKGATRINIKNVF